MWNDIILCTAVHCDHTHIQLTLHQIQKLAEHLIGIGPAKTDLYTGVTAL